MWRIRFYVLAILAAVAAFFVAPALAQHGPSFNRLQSQINVLAQRLGVVEDRNAAQDSRIAELERRVPALEAALSPPSPAPGFPIPKAGIALGYFIHQDSATRARRLDSAKEVGAGFVRFDDSPGRQAVVDESVNLALARGLEPVLILLSSENEAGQTILNTTNFCRSEATRLAGKVRFFEFVNEPDMGSGWTPEGYTAHLKACYAAVKQGNPNAYLSTGGIGTWQKCCGGPDAREWVRRMYAAGAKGHFDALSLHLYRAPIYHADWDLWWMAFEAPGNVRATMDANGDQAVPIWSSENGANVNWDCLCGTGVYGEAGQAGVVDGEFDAMNTYPLKAIAWYLVEDADPGYGLLRPDRTKRPSFLRFQARAAGL